MLIESFAKACRRLADLRQSTKSLTFSSSRLCFYLRVYVSVNLSLFFPSQKLGLFIKVLLQKNIYPMTNLFLNYGKGLVEIVLQVHKVLRQVWFVNSIYMLASLHAVLQA